MSDLAFMQRLALFVAEKLREVATRPGFAPFKTGDLRKSHIVQPLGDDQAVLSSNMPYARRLHDGSGEITIRPKGKKALAFQGKDGLTFAKKVVQPARDGNPWLIRAIEQMGAEGTDFLVDEFGEDAADALADALRARGLSVTRGPPA